MKQSEFKTFIPVKSYDEKTADNYMKLRCREAHSFQTAEDIDPNF